MQPLPYPSARKTDHTDDYFGVVVPDPYRWLEDDNSDETAAWVEAQNRVTFDYLGRIPERPRLLNRLKQLVDYPRYSTPFRKGESIYFFKNDGLQNQSVLFVQRGFDGSPEPLIDPNTFSQDGTIRLATFDLSGDGRYAAYGRTAIPGSDWLEFRVLEIATRRTLPDTLRWIKFSGAAWRGDGFYYSRFPEPEPGRELTGRNEGQQVYYHALGTPQEEDRLVYDEPDHPERFVAVGVTEDERCAVLHVSDNSHRGNALFYRDETASSSAFIPIVPEISEDSFGVVDNVGDKLLVQTNQNAPNQAVRLFDPNAAGDSRWTTVVPERAEPIGSLTTAGGRLFAHYLKDVRTHIVVYDYAGNQETEIALPGEGMAYGFGGERGDADVFYTFNSLNMPPTIFRYDIAARTSALFRAPEIRDFRSEDYDTRQVFYRSKDGTRVPMSLVFKRGLRLDGGNPTLLYGYGGFNVPVTPDFNAMRLAWLELGGVYAQANLRGGSEYGEKWHEAGIRLNKQNVFDDFIAAAEWLIENRYTSSERLAIIGASNGGLLVGAVINERPELFRAAVASVGVMDMLRFHKFTAGAAWVADYGSSEEEEEFRYLLGYSPLHNIRQGARCPAVLITTADHDDRVVPAHSFKYAATLQERADPGRPVLIRIAVNSGHGSSNLHKSIEETADVYAFLRHELCG